MTDEPTLGELARRLGALTDQLTRLVDRLDRDRAEADKKYASVADTKRVEDALARFNAEYDGDRKTDQADKATEERARKARSLQITLAVVGMIVVQLGTISLAIAGFVSQR